MPFNGKIAGLSDHGPLLELRDLSTSVVLVSADTGSQRKSRPLKVIPAGEVETRGLQVLTVNRVSNKSQFYY